ncbi:regulator of chromosome condensation [Eurytemora carolleeae]|uniref:regulator of chromosome condensation n=1 Tax=Eurytemora carolleeae TaxID=1294199 RepID=UPI000C7687AF|nr:regulator of chromosome condensation [Eurytemora carolleeae]|eukprot:XP_023342509.1 regulator of chromosome condensation-like [Eurytemora affinis]
MEWQCLKNIFPQEVDSKAETQAKAPPSRKRGRQSIVEGSVKKLKLDFRHNRGFGHVLTLGQGDTGQLGLGEDILERNKPAHVSSIQDAVDVVAGGMHTAVLTKTGEVYTFGCNDEGSLGRVVEEEEECFIPGKVSLDGKIVQLSAGDSHTAALTEDGRVFAWGTFRDSSGPIGLTKNGIQKTPLRILEGISIKKISSGSDHIAALTVSGDVYTLGNAEQGQLGRVPERFSHRGGRRGLDYLLTPDKIHAKARSTVFKDVWAGSYNTIVRSTADEILVMGLNNYNQMGLDTGLLFFMPTRSDSLVASKVDTLVLGQHHTLLISSSQGAVHAIGRSEYGRLGLGEGAEDAKVPVPVAELKDMKCVDIACGTAVSFAVTDKGHCYSWGMGTNMQLGHGEDDVLVPNLIKSKQLENRSVIAVSSGGQHTVILAKDN